MEDAMKLNWAKRICNIHFKLVHFGLFGWKAITFAKLSSRYLPEEQS